MLSEDASLGPAFLFHPLSERNLPQLAEWLTRPHVAEIWGDPSTADELSADYLAPDRDDPSTQAFIVFHQSRPIGFIQVYVVAGSSGGWWPDETDPGARGIDQFLADANDLNKGLGSAMIRAFLGRIFAAPEVTTVQTDPNPGNGRAIRAYEKAGFVREGVVHTPDGAALLMRCTRRSLAEASQTMSRF